MEVAERERCLVLLDQLTERILIAARYLAGVGAPPLRYMPYVRTTTTRLDYTPESGTKGIGWDQETINKPDWMGPSIKLAESLKASAEYGELLAKGVDESILLTQLAMQAQAVFKGGELTTSELRRMRAALLDRPKVMDDLFGSPCLRIVGLIIQDEPFQVQFGKWLLKFRRPEMQDFDSEVMVGIELPRGEMFDAVASVEGELTRPQELTEVYRWCTAIMKLAIPSGIAVNSIEFVTSGFHGTPKSSMGTGIKGHKNPAAKVGAANVARFVAICELLAKHFGMDLADENQTRINHFAIAYHRYAEALSSLGLIERRIAVAVMGIESLFMTDKDVIGYKLSMRLPKLLSLVGENPVATKKLISDAYGIRSKYVHGDSLSPKEMKKVVEPHGGMDAMLAKLITCLRLALILCLCGLPDKQKRVSLIDNALIDPSKQDELFASVEPVTPLLTL